MSKEIIFRKDGKNKPLIIWKLPWNALYALGIGSNMDAWHARRDLLGTLKRVYEDTESCNMLIDWRLFGEATF